MKEITVIRSAQERAGIKSDYELTQRAGLSYSTFSHIRKKDPGSCILREMRQIIKHTGMTDEDIVAWVRGKEVICTQNMRSLETKPKKVTLK